MLIVPLPEVKSIIVNNNKSLYEISFYFMILIRRKANFIANLEVLEAY